MACGRTFAFFLVLCLLANALCLPPSPMFRKRRESNAGDSSLADTGVNEIKDSLEADDTNTMTMTTKADDDDDDFDDDFKSPSPSSGGGGSNIFSLLNIASALLPSLSGSNIKKNNEYVKKVIQDVIKQYQAQRSIQKRKDISDNVIEIDYASELKPPVFERQESEGDDDSESESSESQSEENNGGEESVEEASSDNRGSNSKQDSASNASNGNGNANGDSNGGDNDSDYDEPSGEEGGGGILGLLAGLSGDGESDLGSLLAAIGGIVANLSGDGVDINAIISTGLGLFVGLLSDEGSNPGEIIGSYLLTSLDTITGGGAQNNGAFFGKFLSTLIKGTSAVDDSNSASGSEENGGMKMADSGGFFASLLMGLLGEMSKNSSGGGWR